MEYANKVNDKLVANGFRSEIDGRNESLSYRIREATKQKVPYIVIIGEREMQNDVVSVRARGSKDTTEYSLDDFVNKLLQEVKNKAREQ